MAIKTIEYEVSVAGITPATEQFGGTQGDHKVTMIEFVTDDLLNDEITDYAEAINGKAMYRFDVYDGEGGIWSSEPKELEDYTLSMELEERHTRHGGKVTIYLVFTVLSSDCETEIELYSFPAVLRLKNRPEGTYQDGENYESVTSLAEVAKSNALDAEKTNKELQVFAAQIEEKLKNGDFDGVGVKSAVIINDELIITYTDGTVQNLGNVKGNTGPQGEKGDKGDMPDVSGFVEKVTGDGLYYRVYAVTDNPYAMEDVMLTVDTDGNTDGQIPRRHIGGNLTTNTPVADVDCANKKYVDDLVSNIGGSTGGGTTDYEQLDNKPKINGVELIGDKSISELGIDISSSGDNWELINKITTTEDVQRIMCSVDSNGNEFLLKKVVFIVRSQPSANANDNVSMYYLVSTYKTRKGTSTVHQIGELAAGLRITAQQNCAYVEQECYIPSGRADGYGLVHFHIVGGDGNTTKPKYQMRDILPTRDERHITCAYVESASTTTMFGAGSELEIWGVRA